MSTGTHTDIQSFEACGAALKALAVALGWQIDPVRLHADLQAMAELARQKGQGASAGLIDEMANAVKTQLLTTRMSIERTIIPLR
ncbi:MAG TPA: hypothetical protein VHB01_03240 [Nitrosospira sp.]|nr:hypothetical protein [Nitrosospira sp.]